MTPRQCVERLARRLSQLQVEVGPVYPKSVRPMTTVEGEWPNYFGAGIEQIDSLAERIQTAARGPVRFAYLPTAIGARAERIEVGNVSARVLYTPGCEIPERIDVMVLVS